MKLYRQKSKPGAVVQRFGDWRQGEPQVLIDNQTWLHRGKPDEVIVILVTQEEYNDCIDEVIYGD